MAVVGHVGPLRRHGFSAGAAFAVRARTVAGNLDSSFLLGLERDAPLGCETVLIDLLVGHLLKPYPSFRGRAERGARNRRRQFCLDRGYGFRTCRLRGNQE